GWARLGKARRGKAEKECFMDITTIIYKTLDNIENKLSKIQSDNFSFYLSNIHTVLEDLRVDLISYMFFSADLYKILEKIDVLVVENQNVKERFVNSDVFDSEYLAGKIAEFKDYIKQFEGVEFAPNGFEPIIGLEMIHSFVSFSRESDELDLDLLTPEELNLPLFPNISTKEFFLLKSYVDHFLIELYTVYQKLYESNEDEDVSLEPLVEGLKSLKTKVVALNNINLDKIFDYKIEKALYIIEQLEKGDQDYIVSK
ncbi:MAG: hypothetical protein IJT59_01910, partial [Desulfovibrionaceae bacterium]|nr:hypothetical protein [Desulfovibrionaceae bacterium]